MKPRLPRSRRTWAVLFVLFAVCTVGVHYGLRWYAYHRGERELRAVLAELDEKEPGWRYEEILAARQKVPDAENGAWYLQQLATKWGSVSSMGLNAEVSKLAKGKSSLVALEDALRTNETLLVELRELHRYPKGLFEWPAGNPPDIYPFLDLGKLLCCDAVHQAMRGNAETAGQSLAALAQMASYLDGEPTMMGRMAANALFVLLQNAWVESVGRIDLPARFHEQIHRALVSHRARGMKAAFRGERASHRMLFDAYDSDDGRLFSLAKTMLGRTRERLQARAEAPLRRSVQADFLRRWTRAIAILDLPAPERRAGLAALAAEPWHERYGLGPFEVAKRYFYEDEIAAKRAVVLEAALIVELFRMKTGAWPGESPVVSADAEKVELRRDGDAVNVVLPNVVLYGGTKTGDLTITLKHSRDRGK